MPGVNSMVRLSGASLFFDHCCRMPTGFCLIFCASTKHESIPISGLLCWSSSGGLKAAWGYLGVL